MDTIKNKKILGGILILSIIAMIIALLIGNKANHTEELGSLILDVNPSIELKINKDFEVETLKAMNDDGVKVLEGYVLKADEDDVEDVVEDIVERLIKKGYLKAEKDNMILVTGDNTLDEKIIEKTNQAIEHYLRSAKIKAKVAAQTSKLSDDDQKKADQLNVSAGKYELIKNVLLKDSNLDLTKLAQEEIDVLYRLAQQSRDDIEKYFDGNKDLDDMDDLDDDKDDMDDLDDDKDDMDDLKDDKEDDKQVVAPKPAPKPAPAPKPTQTPAPVVTNDDDDVDDDDDDDVVVRQPVITTKKVTSTQAIPFTTVKKNDATLASGTTKVAQAGVNGVKTIVTQITYSDGKEVSRKAVSSTITKQPIQKIILIGTKVAIAPKPAPAPAPAPKPAPTITYRLSALAARNMVINRFGGVIQKIEYTYDDNNPLYKGEAVKSGYKVVFEINARTRQFVKWDVANDSEFNDYSTRYKSPSIMNQAANLVVSKSGVSHTFVQKIEFKWDSSEPLFQGEAFSRGIKYSFEINANNLTFKKWDRSTGDETWAKQYFNVLSK